ncbi:MAG: Re/Si-specific NAD(P)(+) transhydrogenase subunit alpha [Gammaproteobacteria bacterium]|uniref:Re/Si-specific NAD(P)(+) transhydrogenase subunit alpha n=1 Tax=Pseudomaricurvus alcaniphilus TaxID=1166482 RepID=UPI00140E8B61|nr:Re/Si-specific NAD(P)(+) transhydrogenase subunit alpha [Pseudomaricurvus alcaniphilus]MBR9911372.1 Re/Si-specific NAD(P)(+) transhydrogenase subunit alpha [Gammaproteobacteria bacterium]NHN39512.1 Re/Si-specific NAD(P)(+) transhydrogenase subunit alpha [Pseudomaricurvus alcaniphilus]
MLIVVPKEKQKGENRVALIPEFVKKLSRVGARVAIEASAGAGAGFTDDSYREAGAEVVTGIEASLKDADIVVRIHKPSSDDLASYKKGAISISYLDPFNERGLIEAMGSAGVTGISMEMIPRSTRSQKMDALSSQANLAGYVMVLKAAAALDRILPMMMTPAGTLKPSKVFVIGAGVAGLQAIATAKRLGAKVTAFDTRSVVAEQVQSVGAKFLHIDLGETGQTKDGYAVQLTPEQLEKQKEGQKAEIAESDIVITTAQVFGRKPPLIVTADAVAAMKPGSVIVDMAAETGGNVEGSRPGEVVVTEGGVKIIGTGNWSNEVPRDASQMYASNVFNLIDEFWDEEQKRMTLDFDNDISGCVITHEGELVNATIRNHYQPDKG